MNHYELLDTEFEPNKTLVDYKLLRLEQNKDHAYSLTAQGVTLARNNELLEAIKKYDLALEIDNNCVQGLVARGAAKANLSKFNEAIKDLKLAIELDPSHENAQMYLDKLINSERKRKDDQLYYNKCLKNGEFLMSAVGQAKKPKH